MMLGEIYYIAKTFLLMSKIALLFVPTLWPKLSGIASGHTDNKKEQGAFPRLLLLPHQPWPLLLFIRTPAVRMA